MLSTKKMAVATFLSCGFALGIQGCGTKGGDVVNQVYEASVGADSESRFPEFDEQLAYQLVQKQVDFGPRVPGTEAQQACAHWLEEQLKLACDTVFRQEVEVVAGNGKRLPCINLIGSINPSASHRILFLAHWDSRPWADQDKVDTDQPILGADDGASGTAVLLTLSKVLQEHPLAEDLGVDFLLVDVEDYGKTAWGDDSYALGAQYWAKKPHVSNYQAQAGILLDMVGAKNARFPLEGYSSRYAPELQKAVWRAAADAGYSSYFVYENGGAITDDHVPVNEIRKIPTIDIINLPAGSMTGFGSYWHTHQDNMDNIDPRTLKAVGQTLIQYLYTR